VDSELELAYVVDSIGPVVSDEVAVALVESVDIKIAVVESVMLRGLLSVVVIDISVVSTDDSDVKLSGIVVCSAVDSVIELKVKVVVGVVVVVGVMSVTSPTGNSAEMVVSARVLVRVVLVRVVLLVVSLLVVVSLVVVVLEMVRLAMIVLVVVGLLVFVLVVVSLVVALVLVVVVVVVGMYTCGLTHIPPCEAYKQVPTKTPSGAVRVYDDPPYASSTAVTTRASKNDISDQLVTPPNILYAEWVGTGKLEGKKIGPRWISPRIESNPIGKDIPKKLSIVVILTVSPSSSTIV